MFLGSFHHTTPEAWPCKKLRKLQIILRKLIQIGTSSLNRSLSGSMSFNFISFGRPPTLWWLLMVWECVLPLPGGGHDSITSGYKVPWTKNSGLFPIFCSSLWANSSKTAMNSLPIIFLFCSGSSTPFNLLRNCSDASTHVTGKCKSLSKVVITRSLSLYLQMRLC